MAQDVAESTPEANATETQTVAEEGAATAPEPEADEAPSAPAEHPALRGGELTVEDVYDFKEQHPGEVDAFFDRHEAYFREKSMPYIISLIAQGFFLMSLVVGFSYMPASYLAALLLAPLRANWMNASIFAGIQTVFLVLQAAVLFAIGGSMSALAYSIMSIMGFVQFVLLIIMTMRIFDINFVRTLLFGIVGGIVQSVVLMVIFFIGFLVVPQSTWMGMASRPFVDFMYEAVLPKVNDELQAERPAYTEATTAAKARDTSLAASQKRVETMEGDIAKLEAQIQERSKAPPILYARIGQMVDRGELQEAQAAYESFAKANAGHPLAAQAQAQAASIDTRRKESAEAEKKERALAKARAAQAAANLKAKLKSGRVTLSETRRALLGLSREEVRQLLGNPSSTPTNAYFYRNVLVYDPLRKKGRMLLVLFVEGHVQGVNYAN